MEHSFELCILPPQAVAASPEAKMAGKRNLLIGINWALWQILKGPALIFLDLYLSVFQDRPDKGRKIGSKRVLKYA